MEGDEFYMVGSKPGVLAGVIILLVAIIAFVMSFQYSYSSNLGPGPGFFPTWLSGILILLSILYIYESVTGKNESSETWPRGKALKHIGYIMGSLVLFIVFFALFGFLVSGIILMFMLFYKEYKWYINLLMSVGIITFIYWLFNTILKVHLPLNGILF